MRRWIVVSLITCALCGCAAPRPLSITPRPGSSSSLGRTAVAEQPTLTVIASAVPTANPFGQSGTAVPTDLPVTSTPLPTPTMIPTPTPEFVIIPVSPSFESNEERWRAQQAQREVLTPPRLYNARVQTALLWYDPATGQVLEIGTLRGVFPAQAQFIFRPTNGMALEVPYRINGDFGLTSISDAIQQRMRDAGYSQSVEAFVFLGDSVVPQQ